MNMTLALTLIDMWLYRVIRGLILSCGPHCAVLLNHEVYQVWFSANDRYAKQAFFFPTLTKHSKQCNIKQNTADKWLCMHTERNLCRTAWLFFVRTWVNWAPWHESDKRKKTNSYEVMLWMYCTWEAAPLGWMWLVSCPGLLAPLWVRSFICRDSRGVWRGFYEALWWYVGKHWSS